MYSNPINILVECKNDGDYTDHALVWCISRLYWSELKCTWKIYADNDIASKKNVTGLLQILLECEILILTSCSLSYFTTNQYMNINSAFNKSVSF